MAIQVIDAIMGTGKSTYFINHIESDLFNRYLIIVPTLNEIERYIINANGVNRIKTPTQKNENGRKLSNFKELLLEDCNIVITHELIRRIDEETLELIKNCDLTVIIDETLQVVETYSDIKDSDRDLLFKTGYVALDSSNRFIWQDNEEYKDGVFNTFKKQCELGTLTGYKKNNNELAKKIMWNFPTQFFEIIKDTYILTYLWTGSIQKCYFELHNIQYEHKTLFNGQIVDYDLKYQENEKLRIKSLINLYDGKLNNIGDSSSIKTNPLSKSWYIKNSKKPLIQQVQKNVQTYFKNNVKTKSQDNMYTCYKDFNSQVRGKGYSKGFVSCNCKGTNDYADKKSLAYLINLFIDPDIVSYFNVYGIELDQDTYALSEMIQWIFRSCIRRSEPINLYIPSNRMRKLFCQWLDNKI